jgi:His-Xaa-Ser system protein HxsD
MTVQLRFDPSVYALEAVQKAAYRFIDRLTIVIAIQDSQQVCDIELVPGISTPIEHLVADFQREMLDQQLRLQIKNETTDVRNLILSFAFSRTGLQG